MACHMCSKHKLSLTGVAAIFHGTKFWSPSYNLSKTRSSKSQANERYLITLTEILFKPLYRLIPGSVSDQFTRMLFIDVFLSSNQNQRICILIQMPFCWKEGK